MRVTQDDLLDALRDALKAVPAGEGHTGPELAQMMGCTALRCRQALLAFQQQGRLEVVTIKRTALDGRQMTLRGYRIKPKKKAA